MKKLYNQPSVQVAHFAPMALMQVVSPATTMDVHTDIPGDQW